MAHRRRGVERGEAAHRARRRGGLEAAVRPVLEGACGDAGRAAARHAGIPRTAPSGRERRTGARPVASRCDAAATGARREDRAFRPVFVAIDPSRGAVKAWVGSPDFAREQFDHVSQARRQPGSTFKPFAYGAALQQGLSSAHEYVDGPVDIPLADGSVWRPTDGGGSSGAPMTLRQGLAQSKNTIAAQLMQDVGAPAVVAFARAAGVARIGARSGAVARARHQPRSACSKWSTPMQRSPRSGNAASRCS